MLIGKLLSCQNHRNSYRGEQTNEGQLDLLFLESDTIVLQIIKQTLVTEPLHVVAGDVVDRLSTVVVTEQTAVDQFAHAPLKTSFIVVILSQNHIPQNA